jgi:hypothetical protein
MKVMKIMKIMNLEYFCSLPNSDLGRKSISFYSKIIDEYDDYDTIFLYSCLLRDDGQNELSQKWLDKAEKMMGK